MRSVPGPRRLNLTRSWPIDAVVRQAKFRAARTGESIALVSKRLDHALQPTRRNSLAIPATLLQCVFDATCPSMKGCHAHREQGGFEATRDYSKGRAKTLCKLL